MDKLRVIKLVMRNPVQLWPTWEEIEWLIETVEKQQNEYNALYSSIDEMDVIISQQQEEIERLNKMRTVIDYVDLCKQLQQVNEEINQYKLQEELLLERLKKQTLQMKEMKRNSRLIKFYEMAEENLSLATELAMLKGGMSG
jgi:predicted RNase H-like nuclease (RuvC/YqgF family)